jgi:hypothetical protein
MKLSIVGYREKKAIAMRILEKRKIAAAKKI